MCCLLACCSAGMTESVIFGKRPRARFTGNIVLQHNILLKFVDNYMSTGLLNAVGTLLKTTHCPANVSTWLFTLRRISSGGGLCPERILSWIPYPYLHLFHLIPFVRPFITSSPTFSLFPPTTNDSSVGTSYLAAVFAIARKAARPCQAR